MRRPESCGPNERRSRGLRPAAGVKNLVRLGIKNRAYALAPDLKDAIVCATASTIAKPSSTVCDMGFSQ